MPDAPLDLRRPRLAARWAVLCVLLAGMVLTTLGLFSSHGLAPLAVAGHLAEHGHVHDADLLDAADSDVADAATIEADAAGGTQHASADHSHDSPHPLPLPLLLRLGLIDRASPEVPGLAVRLACRPARIDRPPMA